MNGGWEAWEAYLGLDGGFVLMGKEVGVRGECKFGVFVEESAVVSYLCVVCNVL